MKKWYFKKLWVEENEKKKKNEISILVHIYDLVAELNHENSKFYFFFNFQKKNPILVALLLEFWHVFLPWHISVDKLLTCDLLMCEQSFNLWHTTIRVAWNNDNWKLSLEKVV